MAHLLPGPAYWNAEDNNTTDAFDASSDKLTTLVEPVPGGLKFVSLASGGSSTCGLLASGLAYCFGNGESGQLGNGSRESSSTPLAAMPTRQFSALCAGDDFACGVDSSTSGAVCWGANSRGQLGSGNPTNTSDSLEGVQVVGGLLFAPTLACGKDFVCAVTAPNGTAGNDTYCWCAWRQDAWCCLALVPCWHIAELKPLACTVGATMRSASWAAAATCPSHSARCCCWAGTISARSAAATSTAAL